MGKKAKGRNRKNEIPPKDNQNKSENRQSDQSSDEVGKKLKRVQNLLHVGLNSPQLSELKLGGRTSRSGRVSLQTSNPGAIPSDVAKFITKTNSKKSPKQNTATKSKQKEIEKSKTTDESSMDTTSESINLDSSFDNKENDSLGVEPDIIETSASSNLDEVKQESVVKEEYEFSSIVIQTKLEDRQIEESFSKSPSEDPQSEGEKGSRDYSDSDSALGSTTSFKNVNNNNENEKNCDWKVGDVVWGSFNRANWFPCMVYPIEDESDDDEEDNKNDDEEGNGKDNNPSKDNNPKPNTIRVKYFNYNGMVSDLPLKNLFKFTNLDAFYDQIKLIGSKKSKMKPFTKTCYRAIAEAEFFLKYPIEKRKELLDEIITMGKSKSRKSDIKKDDRKSERKSIDSAMDVASPAPMSPTNDSPNKNDPISDYIETMQRFDALNAIEFKKEKKERKSDVSKTDEVTVKKEEIVDDPDRRRSGRVVKKRKYEDFLQDDTIKPKPAEENKAKRPRLMKQLSLEERFSITPNDLRSVIKSTNKKRTCLECIENNNEPTYRCNGNGKTKCNGWYHEKCAGSVEHNEQKIRHTTGDSDDFIVITTKNTTLICQNCSNHNKNCFICSEKIVMENDKAEIFQCPTQDCRLAFHKHCIAQWPQTNGFSSKKQIFCPQHTCHTCFYKEVHNTGPLFKCIKCPSAYHVNVNCIPAGTKVLSQTQCICPRHPSAKELKSMKEVKPLNIDWCTMCMTSGNLVCCDYCPNAFHPECINYQEESEDEKYMCRECQEGRLPLYNTIVWTRVGTYRWWPGLIVTEAQARGTPRYEREFCLKFFGSNDHFWTSCERCYNYDGSTFMQKNGNSRLDNVFNLALEEAEEWSKVLQHQETDLSISKPKPYNKITVNRPIPPVKLKKCDDSMQACGCKGTDDDPCGPTSNCTNMHLNFECSKETCIAGDKCQNQKLRKREYAELKIVKTQSRGFGALAGRDMDENTFVIEYVGELIDTAEMNRRIGVKMKNKEKDFYILAVDRDLYVDAEPAGNLARFINHSCDPNCETRKITVDGNTRIGIFTKKSIKAGTELTFDYKMEFIDNKKTSCFCDSPLCSGMIGDKPNKEAEKKPSGISLKKKNKIRRSQSNRDSTSSVASSSFSTQTKSSTSKRRRISDTADPFLNLLDNMLDDPVVIENSHPSL